MLVEKMIVETMNTYGVNNASGRADNSLAANVESIKIGLPVALLGDGNVGDITSVELRVQATKSQFGAIGCQLHSEDSLVSLACGDEALENWWCVVLADALETHSHQAISWEVGGLESTAILASSTESLRVNGETGNRDSVGELLSGDGRAIAILKRESLANIFGGGRGRRIVKSVAAAGAVAVLSRQEEVAAASVEIDSVFHCWGSDGDCADPELALLVR